MRQDVWPVVRAGLRTMHCLLCGRIRLPILWGCQILSIEFFLEKIVMGLYHFRTSDPSEILTATELKCMNRLQKIVTIDHISKANFYVRFGVNPCG